MSIAELAAKINVNAIGGGNPNNDPNNPLVKKRMEQKTRESEVARGTIIQTTQVKPVTEAGDLDHAQFTAKPVIVRKKPAPKKMEFVDSDDDQPQTGYGYQQD